MRRKKTVASSERKKKDESAKKKGKVQNYRTKIYAPLIILDGFVNFFLNLCESFAVLFYKIFGFSFCDEPLKK